MSKREMRSGELYVVFTGFDLAAGTLGMLTYGDEHRSPRIYKKGAVDGRIMADTPVVRTFGQACKLVSPQEVSLSFSERAKQKKPLGVFLPLSELARFWSKRTTYQWASVQEFVTPEEVRAYLKACHPAPAAPTRKVPSIYQLRKMA